MRDPELECLPGWRYCSIPYGEKGPRARHWNYAGTDYWIQQLIEDLEL